MSRDKTKITTRSIGDVIAVTPYLVGYAPDQQMVVLGVDEPTGQITTAVCCDLPKRAQACSPAQLEEIHRKVASRPVTAAYLLAYGDGPQSTPMVDAVRTKLTGHGLRILGALRVADGRYWSYLDTGEDSGSPDGTPIDAMVSDAVMAAAFAGLAPFESRSAIATTIAPVQGAARSAMRAATAAAVELVNGARAIDDDRAAVDHRAATRRFLPRAADRYRRGEILDDTQAALLSIVLADRKIRDVAVALTAHGDTQGYLALWTDLARRVEPECRVPVLTLVAFAAWRDGGGAMPEIATDAALAADPRYTFALIMRDLLDVGVHGPTFDVPQPDDIADP